MSESIRENRKFRIAVREDARAIVDLVNRAYRGDTGRLGWTTESDILDGQRVDEEGVLELIDAGPGSRVLLAIERAGPDGERVLGCVHIQKKVGKTGEISCYLGMLTVDSRLQSAGIGSYLMNTAESYAAREFGARKMSMTVISIRQELIAWYKRRGYNLTSETKPFPYGDERFGRPLRFDLVFAVLEKPLAADRP